MYLYIEQICLYIYTHTDIDMYHRYIYMDHVSTYIHIVHRPCISMIHMTYIFAW